MWSRDAPTQQVVFLDDEAARLVMDIAGSEQTGLTAYGSLTLSGIHL